MHFGLPSPPLPLYTVAWDVCRTIYDMQPMLIVLQSFIFVLLTASGDGAWVTPLSWKSVYGPPPDMEMF